MKHYCISCGTEMQEGQLICPKCGHCPILDALDLQQKDKGGNVAQTLNGFLTARQLEANTQWTKYKCGPQGLAGHGYAAEDANAINDILWAHDVELSGRDNSKNGPNRIVDGKSIQTKYCKTAKESVSAGFDIETGMYAYEGQVLEVPADQYDEAITIMANKIEEGKVPGVADPKDASKLVKKGDVTYLQAKNIAKAGNIDSLVFDAKTQTITALSAFGISFAINLGTLILFRCRSSEDVEDAMKASFLHGIQNGTIAWTSGILTSQVLRTSFGRNFAAAMQWGARKGVNRIYTTDAGKEIIHKLVKVLFNKPVYGGAAKNAATKFFRTNAVSNSVLLVVTSVPDAYRYFLREEMSGAQFVENLAVGGVSIVGGTVGAALGSMLGPAGTIGGGLAGGAVFGWASQKVARIIRKDDTEKMYQLIKVALIRLSHDYMIQTEDEFKRVMNAIANEGAISAPFIRAMYSAGVMDNDDFLRVQIAYERLQYYFGAVLRQRKTVRLLSHQQMLLDSIDSIGEQIKEVETDN